ncbi:MAG: YSC84-related protein [Pseudomonadota bacterium]
MHKTIALVLALALALPASAGAPDAYSDTVTVFKNALKNRDFFQDAYGYAVFPTIGKGGLGVGGAHGKGRVYVAGAHVGDTSMTQLSLGFQAGGQAYSQIVFFKNQAAFDEFTCGNFEFGAQATAVAITAGASAATTTTGSSAGAGGGRHDAMAIGAYNGGMAVFTVAKGGLMFDATLTGQKFNYRTL